MIIPYSTDAPIYHFPRATLGLIAINVAVYAAWYVVPPESVEPFAMILGDGLRPLQWLTHNFLHADIVHLLGNMIFLWCYGIIVEGKIGWLAFLLVYLAIGTAHGAAIQAAYLGSEHPTHVLGASAIIFGLMAMAMIWAPMNELSCLFLAFVGFRVISHEFEVRIFVLAIFQLLCEGGSMAFAYLVRGDPMSSSLLHISGALWGLVAGVLLVKLGWVDCEGWDVFSLIAKRRSLRNAWRQREARLDLAKTNRKRPRVVIADDERPAPSSEDRAAKALARLRRAVEAGDADETQEGFARWLSATAGRPPRDDLLGVIKAMHDRKATVASVAPMRAFCRLYPEGSGKVRLRLAHVLIREMSRPTEARRHLLQVAPEGLDAQLKGVRQSLLGEADRMIDDGVLEVEEDA